jgi:hypothetical protein
MSADLPLPSVGQLGSSGEPVCLRLSWRLFCKNWVWGNGLVGKLSHSLSIRWKHLDGLPGVLGASCHLEACV